MNRTQVNSIIGYTGFIILLLISYLKYGTDIDTIHLIGIIILSSIWLVFWKGLNHIKQNKKNH